MTRDPDVEAVVTLLKTAEGGRSGRTLSGYRPHHSVRDDYQTTGVHDYLDRDELHPGETARTNITFLSPEAYPHCLWLGRVIEIREGSRLVGHAKITRIMNKLLEKND